MADVYLSPSAEYLNIGAGAYGRECERMNQIADVVGYELNRHRVTTRRSGAGMSQKEAAAHSNAARPKLHLALSSNFYNGLVRGAGAYVHRREGAAGRFARRIYRRLAGLTQAEGLGVRESYYLYDGQGLYELKHTASPAVLLKIAFHDNLEDADFIIHHIYEIGCAISKGVLEQLGVPYVSDAEESAAWLHKRYDGIKFY